MKRRPAAMCVPVTALALLLAACGADEDDGDGGGGGGGSAEDSGAGADEPADPTALWVTAADAEEVHRIDLESDEITDTVSVAGYPLDVDVAFGSVWVATYGAGVSRIDPGTGEVELIEVENVSDVAIGDDTVWVGQSDPVGVVPLDPETGEVGDGVELPEDADPQNMVWSDGVLYASSSYDSSLHRVDTDSGDVVSSEEVEGPVLDLELAGDALYVAGYEATVAVDPETLEVQTDHELAEDRPWALELDPDGERLWVASQFADLTTLDLTSGEYDADVAQLAESDDFADQTESMVLADGFVWLAKGTGDVLRIDPDTKEVAGTVTLPEPPGEAHLAVE